MNGLDCQDQSSGNGTAGTDNTWQKNLGDSAEPPGICTPPTGNEPPPHHGGGHGHGKPKKHRDPCKCTQTGGSDRAVGTWDASAAQRSRR